MENMSSQSTDLNSLKKLILEDIDVPTVFLRRIDDWNSLSWDLNSWVNNIGRERTLPFRESNKEYSETPQWEGHCNSRKMTMENFITFLSSDEHKKKSLYFDYKHIQEWFSDNSKILKAVDWSCLGFPERKGSDSTLWIGSEGAHTPCHMDTYGCNLVAQVYGEKQWILFPPACDTQLRATRVPYEESSVFSDINFYSPPHDLNLQGAHSVVLKPGEVLFVPAGWWHYVETVSTAAISINTWIPLLTDKAKQLEEALVRLLVYAVSHVSPDSSCLLNPNEADLKDDENLIDYVQRAAHQCKNSPPAMKSARKKPRRSSEPTQGSSNMSRFDIIPVTPLSEEQFCTLMSHKRDRFQSHKSKHVELNENLQYRKKLINALCNKQVLTLIRDNLLE